MHSFTVISSSAASHACTASIRGTAASHTRHVGPTPTATVQPVKHNIRKHASPERTTNASPPRRRARVSSPQHRPATSPPRRRPATSPARAGARPTEIREMGHSGRRDYRGYSDNHAGQDRREANHRGAFHKYGDGSGTIQVGRCDMVPSVNGRQRSRSPGNHGGYRSPGRYRSSGRYCSPGRYHSPGRRHSPGRHRSPGRHQLDATYTTAPPRTTRPGGQFHAVQQQHQGSHQRQDRRHDHARGHRPPVGNDQCGGRNGRSSKDHHDGHQQDVRRVNDADKRDARVTVNLPTRQKVGFTAATLVQNLPPPPAAISGAPGQPLAEAATALIDTYSQQVIEQHAKAMLATVNKSAQLMAQLDQVHAKQQQLESRLMFAVHVAPTVRPSTGINTVANPANQVRISAAASSVCDPGNQVTFQSKASRAVNQYRSRGVVCRPAAWRRPRKKLCHSP